MNNCHGIVCEDQNLDNDDADDIILTSAKKNSYFRSRFGKSCTYESSKEHVLRIFVVDFK